MIDRHPDYDFDEVVQKASEILAFAPNTTIIQKWTCAGCGNRLTLDQANTFRTFGGCDNCATVTDIRAQGCNYMIIQTSNPVDLDLFGLRAPPGPGINVIVTPEEAEVEGIKGQKLQE